MTQTLSARLSEQASRLHQLAHLVTPLDQRLGTTLILQATQLALASLAAITLERELRASQRTTHELAAEIAAERDIETRHRHARIIAGILEPIANPGCHLSKGTP